MSELGFINVQTPNKVCPICAARFARPKDYSQKQWDERITCSRSCAGIHKKRHRRTGNCAQCGKQFELRPSDKNQIHCSIVCRRASHMTAEELRLHHIEKTRRFNKSHPDYARQARQKRYEVEANRRAAQARSSAWRKNNPEHARWLRIKHAARQRGMIADFTRAQLEHLLRTQKHCHICKKPFTTKKPATIDHVIPLSRGGLHTLSNISLAHLICNIRKSASILHLI